MRILVACEYSGRVRNAFRKKGHDAWSCDLLPADDNSEYHFQKNVLELLDNNWDMMIAFPPCTHLAVSGAPHFNKKSKLQVEALAFVKNLMDAPIEHIAIENPIGIISTRIRKPDQIVQPYWFGDTYKKSTCLWLKNLPLLKKTNEVNPEYVFYKSKKTKSGLSKYSFFWKMGKGHGKERSLTPCGLAEAMAEQWDRADGYQLGLAI